MRRLAIVPARGGSKRLINKNIRPLYGRPLVQHTVALVAGHFESVIVTSDSDEILQTIGVQHNVALEMRPAALATDTSKVIDTVCHYFDLRADSGFDQIWLCLPTCPLRSEEDLEGCIAALTNTVDGVVSVTEYEFPPTFALTMSEGILSPAHPSAPLATGNSRSQDQDTQYRPNGAFYGMWWRSFDRHRNFFRGRVTGYVMPRHRSVDIDTELDFALAELILRRGV